MNFDFEIFVRPGGSKLTQLLLRILQYQCFSKGVALVNHNERCAKTKNVLGNIKFRSKFEKYYITISKNLYFLEVLEFPVLYAYSHK